MKKVPVQKFQMLFRTVILYALFGGLLFSCGEGIRLFPFPKAETAKNDSLKWNSENKIPYQFNIHRLEDNQGNFKTKFQRSPQNHYWIEDSNLNDSEFRLLKAREKINFPALSENIKLPLFSKSGESRAPPFYI